MSSANAVPTEKRKSTLPGLPMIFVGLVIGAVGMFMILNRGFEPDEVPFAMGMLVVIELFILRGIFVLAPNEARILLLFGTYKGTVAGQGMHWVNPFMTRMATNLRATSFESNKLKVNDLDGNPIEIAAIIVYRIVDTAKAAFAVDDSRHYMQVQSESGLRSLASHYPYDNEDHDKPSLRGSIDIVAEKLKHELQQRVALAGLQIVEARISFLAYAPEIAHAMLQRQQAAAIIAARQKIVEGAVGMVESALDLLAKKHVVQLDEERKAQMVSNLLVVLCGERGTQAVVNTGTLYG